MKETLRKTAHWREPLLHSNMCTAAAGVCSSPVIVG